MTDREIVCMFAGIVCGVLLMGLSILIDPPIVREGDRIQIRLDRGAGPVNPEAQP